MHAPNIGWRDVPLERMSGAGGLPVFADNGAKALGQAEMWLGAGRGASHAVVALWGTGIGRSDFHERHDLPWGSFECRGVGPHVHLWSVARLAAAGPQVASRPTLAQKHSWRSGTARILLRHRQRIPIPRSGQVRLWKPPSPTNLLKLPSTRRLRISVRQRPIWSTCSTPKK